MGFKSRRAWTITSLVIIAALIAGCGGAAATPAPPQEVAPTSTPAAPTNPAATSAPAATAGPTPTPTVAPTVTPVSSSIVSAQDSLTLVVGEEPIGLNSFRSIGSGLNAPLVRDNLVDPLTWQSGDDQRIVPTSATTGWEQLEPNKWRFNLRQGVKFHNGEAWNAQAALSSTAYLGVGANDNSSFPYTSGFTAEAVDEFTLDIICDQACPIFPNTAFFVSFQAPNYLKENPTDADRAHQSIGFGPYKLVEWRPA